jgi:hypothetical protein
MTPADALARLFDAEPLPGRMRVRCGWCEGRQPLDGLGPILPGELCSDGLCKPCAARLNAEMDAQETR